MNDGLTATQVQQGKGLGFIPALAYLAAAHVGRVRLELQKGRSGESHGLQSVFGFEAIGDEIDSTDNSHSGSQEIAKEYSQLGQPYMREAEIINGIKFALIHNLHSCPNSYQKPALLNAISCT